MELEKTKAANDEMTKYYAGVCHDNVARGRETDKLRYDLLKLRGENESLKQERSALIDFIEEKGFTCVMNTECPHDMVETGDTFLKETPKTVKVDSIACWNCENCYLRLKDRGKIVCKEAKNGISKTIMPMSDPPCTILEGMIHTPTYDRMFDQSRRVYVPGIGTHTDFRQEKSPHWLMRVRCGLFSFSVCTDGFVLPACSLLPIFASEYKTQKRT